jgi:hypothetical protein
MPPKKASAAAPAKSKKGPSSDKAKKILALRDQLIAKGLDAEKVGLACKGMYRCDKLADDKCLSGILAKLEAIQKKGGAVGGKARARSRSRSRAK